MSPRLKISQQVPLQVALSLTAAILKKNDVLKNNLHFYITPRLREQTRLFKLPFVNIFPFARRQGEFESQNRYLNNVTIGIDVAVEIHDPDAPPLLFVYEDIIEDAIIGQIQIADFISDVPPGMEWVKYTYIGTDFDVDDETERAIHEGLIQFRAQYVKVRG